MSAGRFFVIVERGKYPPHRERPVGGHADRETAEDDAATRQRSWGAVAKVVYHVVEYWPADDTAKVSP